MKILKWIGSNIFFIITLFLIAFIPLYPKLPILDVEHTWVYVRIEDFLIVLVAILWITLFLLKKVTLKTPLTLPIILFWIAGGLSTLHGVLLIFPTLSDVFPNVAFLSILRRIEYISLFFVAYQGMKEKKFIPYIVATLVIVLLLVVGYGMGQKFFGFPAYLTMNEEFAKGAPIQLSELSRVPSTFAGHYDLAAYLVLIIPLFTSLAFGFKNLFIKISLLVTSALGFVLLFMTVSRVSFVVLLMSLFVLLVLQKKRLVIVCLFVLTFVLLSFSPSLLDRFGSTVSEVDVLVDGKTGGAIGHVKEVESTYFKNRVVMRQHISREENKEASSSAILPYELIPQNVALVVESNSPTGENLPQGTSYINLPLSPVVKKVEQYFYQKADKEGTESAEILVSYGDFLIKRAKALDLSFTTRSQGEWPRTIDAFKRNIFLGSGYSSVSLAVDNNYLRILGELGLFGFITFASIFLVAGIYIKKILPSIDSPVARNFVLGFVAGTFGLLLNAILIDVFEASKVAFTYWILMGLTIGLLRLYKKEEVDLYKEFKKLIFSTQAVIIYLFIIVVALYFSVYSNYFVGDDFTWFRWVTDCCNNFISYFTDANGFFYRPGTKLYFSIMHSAFWLNQAVYHLVSLILHFSVAALVFLIAKRIFKNQILPATSAIIFLILPGYSEAVFWISSTGFLFNAFFALLAILFFIYWKERKAGIYFAASLISIVLSLLFHELGVITPLLIILYDIVTGKKLTPKLSLKPYYLTLLFPILPYLILRFIAGSHWFSGDYSYNLFNLPFNIVGNIIGYLGLVFLGPASLSFYQILRNFSKEHVLFVFLVVIIATFIISLMYRMIFRRMIDEERRIVVFGFLFFVIALLPFLGLGNITSRYSYLATAGLVILLTLFLKKTYSYLSNSNGRYVGLAATSAIVIVFVALQLFQLQKIHTDWRVAGEKSMRFIISLEGMYINEWKKERMKFYFVNVPIRNEEAWVFPVGLSDAVWFVSRNQYISVYQVQSLSEALNAIVDPINEKVFEFEGDGGVIERKKVFKTPINEISR